MEAIAAEAGVSRAALYRQFPNKKALLDAVLEYLPARTALNFQTALVVSPGFSGPKAKVLKFEVEAPPGSEEPRRRG